MITVASAKESEITKRSTPAGQEAIRTKYAAVIDDLRRNFQTYGADGLVYRLPGAKGPHPNRVAAEAIAALLEAWEAFAEERWRREFKARWQRYDTLTGRSVRVGLRGQPVAGIVDGIDEEGSLVLRTGGRRRPRTTPATGSAAPAPTRPQTRPPSPTQPLQSSARSS